MTETIAGVTQMIDDLKRGIVRVLSDNANLELDNRLLRESNSALSGQLAVARSVFGQSFIQGDRTSGPNRLNKPKLTEREAQDIRQAHAGGMKQADLARNYGVNPATISRIVNRVYY